MEDFLTTLCCFWNSDDDVAGVFVDNIGIVESGMCVSIIITFYHYIHVRKKNIVLN